MHHYVCRLLLWLIMVMVLYVKTSAAARDCDQTFYSESMPAQRGSYFRSPNYPNQYTTETRCIYKFVGRPTERVRVEFNTFEIQGMFPDCSYDYIDVYIQLKTPDEPLLDAPLLGRFCGNDKRDIPHLMISTHNVLVIVFYTDLTKNSKGFEGEFEFIDASIYNSEALISASTCSYSYDSRRHGRGHIVSPTHPGVYPDNLNCTYELHGQPGQRIKLTFIDFALFHGGDYCPFDYVLIKDGPSMGAETIDVFCGKYEKGMTIYSSNENLYIKFVTRSGRVSFDDKSLDNNADYKFERRGFNISYEFSSSFIHSDNKEASHVLGTECDVRITSTGGSSGTFRSPGYPNLSRNTNCSFFLDGQMNSGKLEKVKIDFTDFAISGQLPECNEGFLAINIKGHSHLQNMGERFCGLLRPPEFISEDPRLILTFSTNRAKVARFTMNYKFLTDYAIDSPVPPTDECKGIYQSRHLRSGEFKSPRYPQNYPANSECTYLFTPRHQEHLLISFDIFDLGESESKEKIMNKLTGSYKNPLCCCLTTDVLELNEISEEDERSEAAIAEKTYYPVKRFCGRTFPAPILVEKEIKLIFRSMNSSQGFRARYDFISKEEWENDIIKRCSHVIHSDGRGGVIKSPRYPQKYSPKTFCDWTILASKRQNKILVQLETFIVEDCHVAVLRVNNGEQTTEYCGKITTNISMKAVLSVGDSANIQFLTSTQALGATGFQLTWTEVYTTGTVSCYGFQCKRTGHCISSELQCDGLPNCGVNDTSDEECPKAEDVQIVHIVIGTSISVFFCIVLLICGVYHRKKIRTRDRNSPEMDQVEVRYVAAGSGSNTTDRLLTIDKSETSHPSPEHTEDPDADPTQKQEVPQTNAGHVTHAGHAGHNNAHRTDNNRNDNNANKQNHNSVPPPPPPETHTNCHPVSAPKIQKVSIV